MDDLNLRIARAFSGRKPAPPMLFEPPKALDNEVLDYFKYFSKYLWDQITPLDYRYQKQGIFFPEPAGLIYFLPCFMIAALERWEPSPFSLLINLFSFQRDLPARFFAGPVGGSDFLLRAGQGNIHITWMKSRASSRICARLFDPSTLRRILCDGA